MARASDTQKHNPLFRDILRREGLTESQWKSRKRRECRAMSRAYQDFLSGCAFTPCRDVGLLGAQLRQWQQELSVKNWGK